MIEARAAGGVVEPSLNGAIGDFVSHQLWGKPGKFEKFSSLGVFENGKIIAGIVFHNWAPEAGVIEISGAATDSRWLTRQVLRTLFEIPFARFRCQLVVFRVSAANGHVRAIVERFGFSSYRVPRLRGRNEDEIIFTLTDDQWRAHPLLRAHHGQVIRTRAA